MVLTDDKGEPIGTRIFGPVTRELRFGSYKDNFISSGGSIKMIKKGIQVKIIAGKDKGKTGEILEINRKLKKVKIKSINMIKKHLKPTKENKGGIISKENFIHLSNIKNIDEKKKKKRIKVKNDFKIKNCI